MMSAAIVIFSRLLHEISRKYLISKLFKFPDIETMLFSTLHLIYVLTSRRFHSGMVVSPTKKQECQHCDLFESLHFSLHFFSLFILIVNGWHWRSHARIQGGGRVLDPRPPPMKNHAIIGPPTKRH